MPSTSQASTRPWLVWVVGAVVAGGLLWAFPLFHIVSLKDVVGKTAALNVPDFAEKFWVEKLSTSHDRATDVALVAAALAKDPPIAAKTYAHEAGIGGLGYYYVRGTGMVVAADKNRIVVSLDPEAKLQVELPAGIIFGNAVRDATRLVNVNDFPSLDDFNALSAELNHRVETWVLPMLREKAQIGAKIAFVGCAEAAEPIAGRPLLVIIPIHVEAK